MLQISLAPCFIAAFKARLIDPRRAAMMNGHAAKFRFPRSASGAARQNFVSAWSLGRRANMPQYAPPRSNWEAGPIVCPHGAFVSQREPWAWGMDGVAKGGQNLGQETDFVAALVRSSRPPRKKENWAYSFFRERVFSGGNGTRRKLRKCGGQIRPTSHS